MDFKFKANEIGNEMLEDLLNNNGAKYKDLNSFIINNFKLNEEDYEIWLEESDLRVYDGIDYDTVIDSWFYVQHLDSVIDVKDDVFEIIPPRFHEEYYRSKNLIYPNTKEGLEKAFFDTIMGEQICKVKMYDKEFYICVDEL